MELKYVKELTILPSMCDSSVRLGIHDTLALFMDAATDHACDLGCGIETLWPLGLFWVTVRTRVRFFRRPAMMERVTLSTWTEPPGRLRSNRDYTLEKDGELLAAGKTEWALVERATGRLRALSDVFTEEIPSLPDTVWDEPFSRMRDEELPEFARRTVRSVDIDLGGHMSNVGYPRSLASVFSCEEWQGMDIRELELVYRAPCFEGDTLIWQMRDDGDALSFRAVLEDGKPIMLARIIKGQ